MKIQSKANRRSFAARAAKRRAHARGLTLVELIIVITIIGALMGVIAFAIFQRKASADKGVASLAAKNWATQLLTYKGNHPDECPTIDVLKADLNDKTAATKDPWGQAYIVHCDEKGDYVMSKGPDKKEGTDDDIRSDKEQQ